MIIEIEAHLGHFPKKVLVFEKEASYFVLHYQDCPQTYYITYFYDQTEN